jgi:hypothetical protein
MFNDACLWSSQQVNRTLELLWYRTQDDRGRDFYFNTVTKKTQWSKPYHSKTFVCSEIEVDAFIYILLANDIIPNR